MVQIKKMKKLNKSSNSIFYKTLQKILVSFNKINTKLRIILKDNKILIDQNICNKAIQNLSLAMRLVKTLFI